MPSTQLPPLRHGLETHSFSPGTNYSKWYPVQTTGQWVLIWYLSDIYQRMHRFRLLIYQPISPLFIYITRYLEKSLWMMNNNHMGASVYNYIIGYYLNFRSHNEFVRCPRLSDLYRSIKNTPYICLYFYLILFHLPRPYNLFVKLVLTVADVFYKSVFVANEVAEVWHLNHVDFGGITSNSS